MRPASEPAATVPRARVWLGVSAALVLAGAGCLALAVRPVDRGTVTPTSSPEASGPAIGDGVTRSTPEAVPPVTSFPTSLRIPAIGVSAPVAGLGLNPDRTVEVPSDPDSTGWFELGTPPGERGSAVILGHVDSAQGPAVFHRLRYLRPGDRATVGSADGSLTRFRVTAVRTYPNAEFPARKVYGPHGRTRGLQLVTCGGAYDSVTGYQANVVVFMVLAGRTSPVPVPPA